MFSPLKGFFFWNAHNPDPGNTAHLLHFPNPITTLQINYSYWMSTENLKSQYLDN